MSALKRNCLSLKDKMEILKSLDQNKRMTEVAQTWKVNVGTISRIQKNRTTIINYFKHRSSSTKRCKTAKFETIDKALLEWFQANFGKIPINRPLLLEKASQFANQFNLLGFKANNRWFSKWIKRNNVVYKFNNSSGEEEVACTDSKIEQEMGRTCTERNDTNTFNIDTQGLCFLCLKNCAATEHEAMGSTTTHSFQKLSRFLDMNYQKIFNISIPLQSNNTLDEAELLVSLCDSCSLEANRFLQMYQELEEVLMKANGCIRNMYRIMAVADNTPLLVQQYREKLTTSNPIALVQASITENFRKELKTKCLSTSRNANTKKLQVPGYKPVPHLMSMTGRHQPTVASSSRKRSCQPTVPLNKPSTVEFVDLDDDDPESSSSPPILISSVSGADGATYSSAPSNVSNVATASAATSVNNTSLKETDSFLESLFALPPPTRTKPGKEFSEIWFNAGDGRVQCKICGKFLQMNSTENLNNHERIHNGTKPIQCVYCTERFRNNWTLRFHCLSNHRGELLHRFKNESVSSDDFKKIVEHVIRDDCKRELETNANIHGGTRNYVCSYCGKSSGRKSDVEGHLIQYHSDNIGHKLTVIQNDPHAFNTIVKEFQLPTTISPASGMPFATVSSFNSTEMSQSFQSQSLEMQLPTTSYLSGATSSASSAPLLTSKTAPQPHGSNKQMFKCNICLKFFPGINLLKKHKLTAHNVGCGTFTNLSGMTITPIKSVGSTNSPGPGGSKMMKKPDLSVGKTSQENLARPSKRFPCPHCKVTFRFSSTHRIHLLNVHRFELFSKHLPEGTTLEEINLVLLPILGDWRPMANGNRGCKFCDRLFTPNEVELSQLRNHTLLAHFDELVVRLQHGIAIRRAGESESVNDNPELTNSQMVVPKDERDDDVIEILPD